MPIPDSLHGKQYWTGLSRLRDEVLVNSGTYSSCRHLGILTFGHARAQWQAETGGAIYLDDEGLRVGNTTLFNPRPTTMQIFYQHTPASTEVVTFRMAIDPKGDGDIDVYRHMVDTASLLQAVHNAMSRRADQRHDLATLTDQDLALVYTEMERGASGLYTPGSQPPPGI